MFAQMLLAVIMIDIFFKTSVLFRTLMIWRPFRGAVIGGDSAFPGYIGCPPFLAHAIFGWTWLSKTNCVTISCK